MFLRHELVAVTMIANIVALFPSASAEQFCGNVFGSFNYCPSCCCNDGYSCCSCYSVAGAIIGGLIGAGILVAFFITLLCCLCPGCPGHRRRTQGRILTAAGTNQVNYVTTTYPGQTGVPPYTQVHYTTNTGYPSPTYPTQPITYPAIPPQPYPGPDPAYQGQMAPIQTHPVQPPAYQMTSAPPYPTTLGNTTSGDRPPPYTGISASYDNHANNIQSDKS